MHSKYEVLSTGECNLEHTETVGMPSLKQIPFSHVDRRSEAADFLSCREVNVMPAIKHGRPLPGPLFWREKKKLAKLWRVASFILTRFQASALSSWTRFQNKAVPFCFSTKPTSPLSSKIMVDFPFFHVGSVNKPFLKMAETYYLTARVCVRYRATVS